MDSKTKASLPKSQILSLVAEAFVEKSVYSINEMNGGFFNSVYNIFLEPDGFQTVLKVGPSEDVGILLYEKEIMGTEVEVMQRLKADALQPVPEIYFADFSRSLIPNDYFFMAFIHGDEWNTLKRKLPDEQNQSIESQLGEITARINSYTNTEFGYYSYHPKFDNWPAACRYMFELLFGDAEKFEIELPISEDEFMKLFDSHIGCFSEVRVPRLIHWDLWPGNVFIEFNEGKPFISGIIDFERAFWGDPLFEYFFAGFEKSANFMRGYGQNILTTASQKIRRIFYDIYLDMVLVIEDGPRQYENKGLVNWGREKLGLDIDRLRNFSGQ